MVTQDEGTRQGQVKVLGRHRMNLESGNKGYKSKHTITKEDNELGKRPNSTLGKHH